MNTIIKYIPHKKYKYVNLFTTYVKLACCNNYYYVAILLNKYNLCIRVCVRACITRNFYAANRSMGQIPFVLGKTGLQGACAMARNDAREGGA